MIRSLGRNCLTCLTCLSCVLASAILAGCDATDAPIAPVAPPAPPAPTGAEPSPARDVSLYDLPATLTDAQGRTVDLAVGRGHPTVVSMFYTTCPAACPILIATIQSIERALPAERRAELRVVLVSFDPERDTPAVLARTAAERGLDARWSLLSTDAEQVRDIAAALGFQYRRRADGDFDHSSIITLLDEQGVITAQIPSAAASITPIVEALGR